MPCWVTASDRRSPLCRPNRHCNRLLPCPRRTRRRHAAMPCMIRSSCSPRLPGSPGHRLCESASSRDVRRLPCPVPLCSAGSPERHPGWWLSADCTAPLRRLCPAAPRAIPRTPGQTGQSPGVLSEHFDMRPCAGQICSMPCWVTASDWWSRLCRPNRQNSLHQSYPCRNHHRHAAMHNRHCSSCSPGLPDIPGHRRCESTSNRVGHRSPCRLSSCSEGSPARRTGWWRVQSRNMRRLPLPPAQVPPARTAGRP